ncbi:hypothetical protein Q9966_013898 [Columba livia]|nr:hypothetical protein Q9966_013898 [Columba livia]
MAQVKERVWSDSQDSKKVSLSECDHILLCAKEAEGYWRPGVFMTKERLVQSSSHHLWSPPAAKAELGTQLDLLALLQEHGPSTEGIFRLAAGERATRELREALDSGAQVQLESQPVHLLAAILKEFLRKIPSKLLQAELYQDWMSALHNTSRQERLAGLKELVQSSSHHLWSPPAAKAEFGTQLDLLALLQEHGPSTEGIFRLAAGERATRELREALDSGAQVQLESQPVHLLAAILKEFLRKIPSKLLQAELYQDWMSALHNTSRQERLAGLKESPKDVHSGKTHSRHPIMLLLYINVTESQNRANERGQKCVCTPTKTCEDTMQGQAHAASCCPGLPMATGSSSCNRKFQEDYANNSIVNENRIVKGKLENEAHWLNISPPYWAHNFIDTFEFEGLVFNFPMIPMDLYVTNEIRSTYSTSDDEQYQLSKYAFWLMISMSISDLHEGKVNFFKQMAELDFPPKSCLDYSPACRERHAFNKDLSYCNEIHPAG